MTICRPILFNGDMIRAILSGKKNQTRRPIELCNAGYCDPENATYQDDCGQTRSMLDLCPYGTPGDQFWVRETWARNIPGCESQNGFSYKADHISESDGPHQIHWKPSIFMPRSASRITLEILNVRVQRLQQITPKDAIAEGVTFEQYNDPLSPCDGIRAVNAFRDLWDSIYANRGYSWDANPWLWVIEFKREVAA